MQSRLPDCKGRTSATAGAFILVFVVIMIIAVLNAPTKGGPQVMASMQTYLAEVGRTALPFLGIIAIAALILSLLAARTVWREWPNPNRRSALLAGYAFLAPYLIVTLTFTVGVVLFAFYISFFRYDIFTSPVWAGLTNYTQAFQGLTNSAQKDFIQALYNVIWYALIVVPLQTTAAILLAVIINGPMRFSQFFRTVFYAPSVTSSVVITLIFMWLYLNTGYINYASAKILSLIGVQWQAVNWLQDPRGLVELIVGVIGVHIPYNLWFLKGPSIAWMAIMFQNIFTTSPTFMIMFLAALQEINPTLYEAASIDGASRWQSFWSITLPMLRPIILLVVVLGTIGTLQVFDQVYLATQGGPLGTTQVPVFLIFTEALGTQGPIQMGYASALAFILAIIIFFFTFLQRRFLERGTEIY